jgi:hypothetical protein
MNTLDRGRLPPACARWRAGNSFSLLGADACARWALHLLLALSAAIALAACGGGNSPAPVVAPAITSQPASLTVSAGQTATFNVTASGSDPLAYQWQRNGIAVVGATSASLTLAAAAGDNGALYAVVVSNAAGSATSNAATLTVDTVVAPAIGTQPAAVGVTAGSPATFTVVATGSGPLAYQWRRNGADITGATGASYTLAAPALADNGALFSVRVSNAGGDVISANALLTVTAAIVAPAIATQPANQTVNAGQTATFSVVATGSAPLAYQWRRNGTDIAGATAASYTTPATVDADNGARFSVVVSNAASTVATSSDALLSVTPALVAPAITTQPANASVNVGASATFSVVATGSAPLAYQWRKNGTPIAGANSASYTTPAAVAGDDGALFAVLVSNGAGSQASNNATLTVAGAKAWGTATLFETAAGEAREPQVAANASGDAVAVWSQHDGTAQRIYARRHTAGVGWGSVERIDAGTLGAGVAQVAIDDSGNAMAVWQQDGLDTTRRIYANRYTAGTGWGSPQLIGSSAEVNEDYAQVAISANGDAIAVWQQVDRMTGLQSIAANRFVLSGGWGTHVLIEASNRLALGQQVAVDASGNAHAVWLQSDGTAFRLFSNRYIAGSGWGTPTQLSSGIGSAADPQVAVDATGNAVVVFVHFDGAVVGATDSIWARRYVAGTGWMAATLLESGSQGADEPQVAVDARGNAYVVWTQVTGGNSVPSIHATRFTTSGGWAPATLIESDPGAASEPRIAAAGNGHAIAIWRRGAGSIYASHYEAGGWGVPALLGAGPFGATEPRTAIDASGDAFAIWAQFDGTVRNIWTSSFR